MFLKTDTFWLKQKLSSAGPVTKLKNLLDVHSILLGAVENFFNNLYKKKATKLRVTFKIIREENQHLLGKLIFENGSKCASVGYTR